MPVSPAQIGLRTSFALVIVFAALLGVACGEEKADPVDEGGQSALETTPEEPTATDPEPDPDPEVPDEPAGAVEGDEDPAASFTSTGCEPLGLGITAITATATDCGTAHGVAGQSTGASYSAEGFDCVVNRVEKAKPNDFHHYVCTSESATITFRARQ